MRSSFVLSLLSVVVPALGAPTLIPITKHAGPYKQDSYIITFKDAESKSSVVAAMKQRFAESSSESSLTYEYDVLNGVAARIAKADILTWVQTLGGVESIEPNQIVSISYEQGIDGLSYGDNLAEPSTASPVVARTGGGGNGEGVVVYGIDTGIYTQHNCFGGRASWGATFGGYEEKDGNGHGTHTAATVVGKGFGLATGANIIAVKVLSDAGSGAISDIIAGLDFVQRDVQSHGKPSIATMSLGSGVSAALDSAVARVISAGIHATVAAGNSNQDAKHFSPARVESANTIGAIDSNNQKASFSNYGKVLDVWALGVDVTSAWIGNPDRTNTISGTSMATPQVAGMLAVALSRYGQKTPAALSKDLIAHAKPDVKFTLEDRLPMILSPTTNLRAVSW